jgi:DNA-binding NarL/FixJ family response regulator
VYFLNHTTYHMQGITILLADEYPLTRKGIRSLLQSQLSLIEVTEVGSCKELMRELVKREYTHLILDNILSDGSTLELLPNIRRVYPELRIMLLSRNSVDVYVNALKQYGIYYCLSKVTSEEETLLSLRRFLNNEQPARIINNSVYQKNPFTVLATREFEICRLVVSGLRSKAIAEHLKIKINTVSTIKKRIFEKTFTNNLAELITLAELYNINNGINKDIYSLG